MTGAIIMVPREQAHARCAMKLAEGGMPKGRRASVYEIFDKSDTLGATSFRTEHQSFARAWKASLARTIKAIDRVQAGAAVASGTARTGLCSLARQDRAVGLDRACGVRGAPGSRSKFARSAILAASAVNGLKPQAGLDRR